MYPGVNKHGLCLFGLKDSKFEYCACEGGDDAWVYNALELWKPDMVYYDVLNKDNHRELSLALPEDSDFRAAPPGWEHYSTRVPKLFYKGGNVYSRRAFRMGMYFLFERGNYTLSKPLLFPITEAWLNSETR